MKLRMQLPNKISQGSFSNNPEEKNVFQVDFLSLWIIMDLAVFQRIDVWVPGYAEHFNDL